MLQHWLWPALYWSWIATEFYVAIVTRTRRDGGKISDRGSMIGLWIVIFSSIFLASGLSAMTSFGAMPDVARLRTAAVAVFAVGLMIRWSAIYTLGRAFSANVAIHDRQKLNLSGLFRYMRHPSYTGMMIIFLALGLRMHNWVSLLLVTVPPFAALLYRMHVEEAALTGAFGEEYVEYSLRTKRLIPGIY